MKTMCLLALGLAFWGFLSCSTAPKRPAETFSTRNMAENYLELANKAADQGRREEALRMLDEARRIGVSVDDPRLLIRERIARGNVLSALGRADEAAEVWNSASAEASAAGDQELAASVRIYTARTRLSSEAEAVRDQVKQDIAAMKTEKLSIAFGWVVIGLAERELGRWAEGEAALKQALKYHEKNNYLEKAAEDWYLIASIRSVSGQYDGALEALKNALDFDRRAENSYGLGMDWRAIGDVQTKAGNRTEARAAYRRAIAVFRAIDLEPEAAAVEARLPE